MRIFKQNEAGRRIYKHFGMENEEPDIFPINFNDSYFEDRKKIHIIETDMYWDELDHTYFTELEREASQGVHIRYQKIGVVFRILDKFGSIKERMPFTLPLHLNAGHDGYGRLFKEVNPKDPYLYLEIHPVEVKKLLGINK